MSLFDQEAVRKLFGVSDLAIDLGTANTRVCSSGSSGLSLYAEEPSMVAVETETGLIRAVGIEAVRAGDEERGGLESRSPLRSGVISDVESASYLLRYLIERVSSSGLGGLVRPRALACIPTDASAEEEERLVEATRLAGARSVVVVREPLAAAVGAGLDIASPHAQMLVDIGDGVTDIAVVRSSELVLTAAVRCACSDVQRSISRAVAREHGIFLNSREAQRLSHRVGALAESDESDQEPLYAEGRELSTGLSMGRRVEAATIRRAMEPVLSRIVERISQVVRNLPDELACEVIESGICLTGGGANLSGIPERLRRSTLIDVRVAEDPMKAVIIGAQRMLEVGSATGFWNN